MLYNRTGKHLDRELTTLEKKGRRRRRFLRTLTVIVGILVIVRIIAPIIALKVINKKLAGMPEYICHIDDLDLHLFDASVVLHGLELRKKNGQVHLPFLKCARVHAHLASYEARAVNLKVGKSEINLVKGKDKASSQLSLPPEWIEFLENLPMSPDDLTVAPSEVHYIEIHKNGNIDLAMKEIEVTGENLENLKGITDSLPSRITLTALVEGAKLKSVINLDQKKPEVRSVTTLAPLQLRKINGILRNYTEFDVEKGTFSAYLKFNLKKNRISGYGIPTVKDLVLFEAKKDKDKPFGKRVTEAVIQVGANMFKKKDEKIIARVEFSGTIKDPKLNIWQIIVTGLSNSFHQSVKKGLENPMNPGKK